MPGQQGAVAGGLAAGRGRPAQHCQGGRQGRGGPATKQVAPAPQSHKAINRQITTLAEAGSLPQLLEYVDGNLHLMNGINLATALHRVARLAGAERKPAQERPALQRLFAAVVATVLGMGQGSISEKEMPVQSLSIVTWSCAMLQLHHGPLLQAVAEISATRLGDFKPYELSNLLWAYAKLGAAPPELLSSITAHLLTRTEGEYKVQCLATIAWSYATLKRRSVPLFNSLAGELVAHAMELKPQEISNALWAFAKSRHSRAELFQALGDAVVQQASVWSFKPQELSNTAWAFGSLGLQHRALLTQIEDAAVRKHREMAPQNLANILWAFAKLQAPVQPTTFPLLLEAARCLLPKHKAQELSAIVWAAAQCCPGHPTFFGMAIAVCTQRLNEFSPNALAHLVKAFSTTQVGAPPAFMELLERGMSQLHSNKPSFAATLLRAATVAALNPAFAPVLDRLERSLPVLCEHLAGRVEELPQAELLEVLATMQMRPVAGQGGLQESLVQSTLLQPAGKILASQSVGSMSTTASQAEEGQEHEVDGLEFEESPW